MPQGGKQYLIKVVDRRRNGKVAQRIEAQLGAARARQGRDPRGAGPGDMVVTAGQARLMRGDGLPLRVVDLGRSAASAGAPTRGRAGGRHRRGTRRGAPALSTRGRSG